MSGTVGADEPRAINRKTHRQALDCNIVHDLIVGALQESRINGGKRLETFRGEACGESHSMLLGNADIESARGELFTEQIEARARRHGCRDRDDLVVLFRVCDERFREDLCIAHWPSPSPARP